MTGKNRTSKPKNILAMTTSIVILSITAGLSFTAWFAYDAFSEKESAVSGTDQTKIQGIDEKLLDELERDETRRREAPTTDSGRNIFSTGAPPAPAPAPTIEPEQ